MNDRNVSINIFDLIDSICADFRREWKAGKRPQIEDYLLKVPENARETLLRNLLPVDIRYRERGGEEPQSGDYLGRFPQYKRVIGDAFNFSTSVEMQAMQSTPADDSADIPATFEAPAANRIGEYELVRELGRGGFGVVYEANHVTHRNRVALKTLPTGQYGQEINAERLHKFRQEFRSLSEINHPNLVGMQSLEVDGGQWFFTMDLIEGEDFLRHVRPGGKLNESSLRESLKQLVAGIVALHEQRILHRDLKPSNVLVSSDGQVSILDFGLVAELEQRTDETTSMQTRNFAGTPQYAAPEQVYGERSTATDWYALGAMLFEVLTGEPPFRGTASELLITKQNEDAPALSGRANLPQDLAALVDGLLQRAPQNRPDSAAICDALGIVDETVSHDSSDSQGDRGDDDPRIADEPELVLIGREKQLAQLEAAKEDLLENRQPVVVWITGLSGEGKSSLAEKFLQPIRRRHDMLVLSGRCYDRESVPFKVVDSQIESLVRYLRSRPDAEVEQILPNDIEMLAEIFPLLRRIEPINQRFKRGVAGLEDRQIRNLAFAALRDLLITIGDTTPIVMFIDDLQWGDADSAEVLTSLLAPPNPPAALLLGSYRSDEMEDSPFLREWRERTADKDDSITARQLTVEPLTEAECLGYIGDRFGETSESIEQQASELFASTGGNPYFLEQLVEGYDQETGLFHHIPLREIIAGRLQRCPRDGSDVLDAISVAGKAVSVAEVSAIVGQRDSTLATITHLRSERLVRLVGSQEDQLVDTYHDKIRETVLTGLEGTRKRDLHRRFGEFLEASCGPAATAVPGAGSGERVFDLAWHFSEAGDTRAFTYQLEAGKRALEAYAMDTAVTHLRQAHELLRPEIDRATEYELHYYYARALAGCLLLDDAVTHFQTAIELANSPLERAASHYDIGEALWKQSDHTAGHASFKAAFAELGERLPSSNAGRIIAAAWNATLFLLAPRWLLFRLRKRSEEELAFLSTIHASMNWLIQQFDISHFIFHATRSCVVAKFSSNNRTKSEAFSVFSLLLALAGCRWLARPILARAEKHAAQSSEVADPGVYDVNLCDLFYATGDHSLAEKYGQQAIARLSRSGHHQLTNAHHFLWHSWSVRGDCAKLLYHAGQEEEIARRSNDKLVVAWSSYGLAEGFARAGQVDRGLSLADQSLAVLQELDSWTVTIAKTQKARVQLQMGDYAGAQATSGEAIWEFLKLRLIELTAPACAVHVEACLAAAWATRRGNVSKRSLRRAAWFAFLARRLGFLFPNTLPHAYRVSGRLAAAKGKTKKGIKCFDKAIAAAKRIGAEYEHARALIDKSTLDCPDAASDRQRGLELLEDLGCVLPDAEVEYLELDRLQHYESASPAQAAMQTEECRA